MWSVLLRVFTQTHRRVWKLTPFTDTINSRTYIISANISPIMHTYIRTVTAIIVVFSGSGRIRIMYSQVCSTEESAPNRMAGAGAVCVCVWRLKSEIQTDEIDSRTILLSRIIWNKILGTPRIIFAKTIYDSRLNAIVRV